MKFLNDTQARRLNLNPVFKRITPAFRILGKVVFEREEYYEHPVCEMCDTKDCNRDTFEVFNGNMLIEYPKKSKRFWCPCCFQNNYSERVVNKVLGTPEERGW